SCGRSETDVVELARMVSNYLNNIAKPVKVAVMGCVVNGPGEAKDADVGIACGKGRGALFKKGKVIRTVDEAEYFQFLTREIESFVN
ncbi:MAG: flavodoxin-dependent (E)-4-hydroxy-3-methylbut-2-enyl-diphosphate synthase, partial [Chloroflexi bacterium]|nr:flavodoxin-dependent (E)-4-hydroxy-3-methylbut-2-enyl-diphosphate synthase [Chloroflexota bacterium]